jgi:hypothetical protein
MFVRLTRTIAALLCFTLLGTQLALAAPTSTQADMYKKVDKYKLGTCITVKETDGTELAGRILVITPDNVTIETLGTGETVVIAYADLVSVKGPSYKAAWILGGVGVGLMVGMGLLFRYEVGQGKKNQDAFCQANNIPPSECAGG